MLRVDFYHLTRDPAEKLVPMLAGKSLDIGKRLLLMAQDESLCVALSKALWSDDPASFLAHDYAGSEQQAEQPILISDVCEPANGATYLILADGLWSDEALTFERVFFLFTAEQVGHARTVWRDLATRKDVNPHYWKQTGGRWIEGP